MSPEVTIKISLEDGGARITGVAGAAKEAPRPSDEFGASAGAAETPLPLAELEGLEREVAEPDHPVGGGAYQTDEPLSLDRLDALTASLDSDVPAPLESSADAPE